MIDNIKIALIMLFFVCTVSCLLLLLQMPPKPEFIVKRTVVLQDGRRIKTTIYHMSQWALKTGVTIGNNDYAGAYTVLEGWK